MEATNNLTVTGTGHATGGKYNQVTIRGQGVIDGPLRCGEFHCLGTVKVNGLLQSEEILIRGEAEFMDIVESDHFRLFGEIDLAKDVQFKTCAVKGRTRIHGSAFGQKLNVKGDLFVNGKCEAESLELKGAIHIVGLLNIGNLHLKLVGNSKVSEVGGENIIIRGLPRLLNPFTKAHFTADVIEGDDIFLQHTTAKVVRGNNVKIGRNCTIELVEYKHAFHRARNATVHNHRMF